MCHLKPVLELKEIDFYISIIIVVISVMNFDPLGRVH